MKKPNLYDSAYPGSMAPREDGQYVDREDSDSLAAALLRNLNEANGKAEDWMNEAIRHEREAIALRDALSELCRLKLLKDTTGKTPDYARDQPIAWAQAFALLGLPFPSPEQEPTA